VAAECVAAECVAAVGCVVAVCVAVDGSWCAAAAGWQLCGWQLLLCGSLMDVHVVDVLVDVHEVDVAAAGSGLASVGIPRHCDRG
jgi:hypothetical protein